MSKNLGQAASLTEGALSDAAKLLNKVWERSSQDVVETLQRAMLDTSISFDELATLSSIDRDTIVAMFSGQREIDAQSSALLAATLSARIAEQIKARARRDAPNCLINPNN